jgi:predicted dienelactone hydrolase
MAWLTEPLAEAGFLVIAFDHHGNNFVDGYVAESFGRWWERPLDATFVLDQLGEREQIGPTGAAGFSIGGYTAAALLGARVDPDIYSALLSGAIHVPPPDEYPDIEEELRGRLTEDDVAEWTASSGRDYADDRVRAGFLVCPAQGYFLDKASLAEIERPVAVRWVDGDVVTPPEQDAKVYAGLIPGADGRSADSEAGHYAFLADNPDFVEVRRRVAADAIAFFEQQLAD